MLCRSFPLYPMPLFPLNLSVMDTVKYVFMKPQPLVWYLSYLCSTFYICCITSAQQVIAHSSSYMGLGELCIGTRHRPCIIKYFHLMGRIPKQEDFRTVLLREWGKCLYLRSLRRIGCKHHILSVTKYINVIFGVQVKSAEPTKCLAHGTIFCYSLQKNDAQLSAVYIFQL